MKKLFLVPLVAVLVLSGCVSRKPVPTTVPEGPAEATDTAGTAVEEPEKAPEKKLVEKTIMVSVPLKVKEISLFSPEILDSYTKYTYQEAPGLLPVIVESFDMDNKATEILTYEYSGNLLSKTAALTADMAVKSYHMYSYDDAGNMVSDGVYDAKNKLQTKSVYEYDGEGRKIRWNVRSGGDILQAYTTYAYQNGTLSQVDFFTAAGEKENYITYEYDGEGRPLREFFFSADGKLEKYTEYAYKDGRLFQEIYYRGNKSVNRKVSYIYNEKGDITEAEYANASGKIQEIKRNEYAYRDVEKKIQVYE